MKCYYGKGDKARVIGYLEPVDGHLRYRKARVLTDRDKALMAAMQNDPQAWRGSSNGQADYLWNPFSAYPYI